MLSKAFYVEYHIGVAPRNYATSDKSRGDKMKKARIH